MAIFCYYERELGKSGHPTSITTRTRHRKAWLQRQKLNLPIHNAANEPAGVESNNEIVVDESQTLPSSQNQLPEYDSHIDIGGGIDFERGKSAPKLTPKLTLGNLQPSSNFSSSTRHQNPCFISKTIPAMSF